MSLVADGANVLLGKGKMFFDRFTAAGVSTGHRFLGNGNALAITTADELKKIYSSAEAAAPLLKQVSTRRTATLSISLNEFTYENVALEVMGSEAYYAARAGGAVSAYNLGIAAVDRVYKFTDDGPIASSPAPVIKIGAGAALTAVTDYVLDLTRGTVYLVSNATTLAQVDGIKLLNVAYTTSAIVASTNKKVIGGNTSLIEGAFRFEADPATGPKWDVEVWRVDFTPDGEFGLITEDFGEFKLKGEIVSDAAHSGELYRLTPR